MGWKTVFGTVIEYPFALAAKAVKSGNDEVCELVSRTKTVHDEAVRLDCEVSRLRQENQRLTHENEFMRRLISEKDGGI